MDCGVSLGSCLGPLLFTLYTSRLFQIVQSHLPDVHCFADDTQLYISFRPNDTIDESSALNALESCVDDIHSWMLTDSLKLKDVKSEFLVIGTPQQLANLKLILIVYGWVIAVSQQSPLLETSVLGLTQNYQWLPT